MYGDSPAGYIGEIFNFFIFGPFRERESRILKSPIFLDSGNRCSKLALSKETTMTFYFTSSFGVKSPLTWGEQTGFQSCLLCDVKQIT